MNDEVLDDETATTGGGVSARLVIAGLLVVGIAAFVLQNTDSTPVSWLVFEGSAPLWLVIVASVAAGAVLSELVGWMLRRRKRRTD